MDLIKKLFLMETFNEIRDFHTKTPFNEIKNFNTMPDKLTKQQYLDIEAKTDEEKIIQLFLTSLNKTKVSQLRRAFQELDRVLFKTWMKETPFIKLLPMLQNAESYLHSDDKNNNNNNEE